MALVTLAENINVAGNYELRVDAQYLLTSMASPTTAKRGNNGDLWTRFYRAREQKPQCTLRVARFSKSHITARELAIGCATIFDMRGNTFADEMAGRAAARVEVLPGQAGAIQAVDGMAWKVRMRIIEANLAAVTDQPKREFLPPRTPSHGKTRQQTKSELLSAIAAMGHVIKRKWGRRNSYHFEKCGKGGSLSKWKLTPTSCSAILARHGALWLAKGASSAPAETSERGEDDDEDPFGHGGALDEREEESAVLGGGVLHHTHETWLIRGIGAWAMTAPRLLTKECSKEPGRRAYELRRLIACKEPNRRTAWPRDTPLAPVRMYLGEEPEPVYH